MSEKNYLQLVNDEIDSIIKSNSFGQDFNFNVGQREVVTKICVSFLQWLNKDSDVDNCVVYAPTGYGKSIISMFAARVLQRFNYSGYILTVDLLLQQQYEQDFKNFGLNYHSIKGTDNYKCFENGKPFSQGECHSMNLSYQKISQLNCYRNCGYLQARNRAIRANVSLLNYQYWLMQRNHVTRKVDEESAPFKERDFVFLDECHKLSDIVQSSFSIKIDSDLVDIIDYLNANVENNGFELPLKASRQEIQKELDVLLSSSSKQEIKISLENLQNLLALYSSQEDYMREFMKESNTQNDYIPDEWVGVFKKLDIVSDIESRLNDYIKVANEVGYKNIVVRKGDGFIELLSLKEDFLIKKYVLKRSGFKIFMSATLGDINRYVKLIGLDKSIILKLKSRFSYEESPINIIKGIPLDYKNKEKNIDRAIHLIDHIIGKHHMAEKGLIHTGSYEFTKTLMYKSKFRNRFMSYTAKNKRSQVKKFMKSQNKILIGPSVMEGLDLKGDLSRFQIMLKVPYPSLNDELIKAKLKESQSYYDWITSVHITQAMNRSIRFDGDWAISYVIDSCFIDLVKKKLFDMDFMKRLQIYDYVKDGFKK